MLSRLIGLTVASALVVIAQVTIFNIHWFIATLAVPIAFLLATVASRVVGETGIPPIGAIGKVSRTHHRHDRTRRDHRENLISANVAGGAAGQSADLLNDLKVGFMIGMPPRFQIAAQCFGVLTGSVIGSIVYLQLIPDPATMLITEEWPAPAVATWKVVAETLSNGLGSIPVSALWAVANRRRHGCHRRVVTTPTLAVVAAEPARLRSCDGDPGIDIDHDVSRQSRRQAAGTLSAEFRAAISDRGRIRSDRRRKSDRCCQGIAGYCWLSSEQ